MRLVRLAVYSMYIGTFEILRLVEEVAYDLALSWMFSYIPVVFHVFILRRYDPDESHVLQYDIVEFDECLAIMEASIPILVNYCTQEILM